MLRQLLDEINKGNEDVIHFKIGSEEFLSKNYTLGEYKKIVKKFTGRSAVYHTEDDLNGLIPLIVDGEMPVSLWKRDLTTGETTRYLKYIGCGCGWFLDADGWQNNAIIFSKNDGKYRRLDHLGSPHSFDAWCRFFTGIREYAVSGGKKSLPKDYPIFLLLLAIESGLWSYKDELGRKCLSLLDEVVYSNKPISTIMKTLSEITTLSTEDYNYIEYPETLTIADGTKISHLGYR